MPGFMPGIHVFLSVGKPWRPGRKRVHARLRRAMPGHDVSVCRSKTQSELLRDAADERARLVDHLARESVQRLDQRRHLRARRDLDDQLGLLRITQEVPFSRELGESLTIDIGDRIRRPGWRQEWSSI